MRREKHEFVWKGKGLATINFDRPAKSTDYHVTIYNVSTGRGCLVDIVKARELFETGMLAPDQEVYEPGKYMALLTFVD